MEECDSGDNSKCVKLCNMSSDHHKSHYSAFCSSSSSANSYNDNVTPSNVEMDGNYAMEFQFWMVAAAFSVAVALVAIFHTHSN